MKKFLLFVSFFTLLFSFFLNDLDAATRVRGYYRKDGTYVQPHYRSNPDGNPYNNWSYPGNVNPYTGAVAPGNSGTYLKNYYEGETTQASLPSATSQTFNIPAPTSNVNNSQSSLLQASQLVQIRSLNILVNFKENELTRYDNGSIYTTMNLYRRNYYGRPPEGAKPITERNELSRYTERQIWRSPDGMIYRR